MENDFLNKLRPICLFWPNFDTVKPDGFPGPSQTTRIEYWVKEYGVNVLWYNDAINYNANDWDRLHGDIVPRLLANNYPIKIIRMPASMLHTNWRGSKSLEELQAFDLRYADQLLAFSCIDEPEDKMTRDGVRLEIQKHPALVGLKMLEHAKYIESWMPELNIPLAVLHNGLHLQSQPKPEVAEAFKTIDSRCKIIAFDAYTGTQRQIQHPDGTLRYPVSGHWTPRDVIKQWANPTALIWGTIDTANQYIYKGGEDASKATAVQGAKWLASRAPTPDEVLTMVSKMPDGHVYFPQSKHLDAPASSVGKVNDGTDHTTLGDTLKTIAQTLNGVSLETITRLRNLLDELERNYNKNKAELDQMKAKLSVVTSELSAIKEQNAKVFNDIMAALSQLANQSSSSSEF